MQISFDKCVFKYLNPSFFKIILKDVLPSLKLVFSRIRGSPVFKAGRWFVSHENYELIF
jgi:hypothetical protein